jgi:hypothetical protein
MKTDMRFILSLSILSIIILVLGVVFPLNRSKPVIDRSSIESEIQQIRADTANNSRQIVSILDDVKDTKKLTQSIPIFDSSRVDLLEEQRQVDRGDIQYLLSAVGDVDDARSYYDTTTKDIQQQFDALTDAFAKLQTTKTATVQITNAIIMGTVAAGKDTMLADVVIVISNPTIYDIRDSKLHLILLASSTLPEIKDASISGLYSGTSWNYTHKNGDYLFFETTTPIVLAAEAQMGLELKLIIHFVAPVQTTIKFLTDVELK